MALRAGKDEIGIRTSLNVGSKCRLDIIPIGIMSNLLKLVYGHKAMTRGLREIAKYLIERNRRIMNISQTDTPHRVAINIKRDFRPKRQDYIEKQFPRRTPLTAQNLQDGLAQSIDKVLQTLGRVDVNKKSKVMFFDFRLVKTVSNKVCFAQSSWRNHSKVILIGQHTNQKRSLLYSVTEIFWPSISIGYERITQHIFSQFCCKVTKNILYRKRLS